MNFNVKHLEEYDPSIMEKVINVDTDAFGENTLSPFTAEALIRFGKVFVIESNNEMVGVVEFIKSWNEISTVYLVGMSIKKANQNKGLGTLLMEESIRVLKEEGIKNILLHVHPDNTRALHLYQDKFLFNTIELRRNEFGYGEDRLLLGLNLDNKSDK